GGTWRGIPARCVALLLEIGTGNKRPGEIDRVIDDRGHREPLVSIGLFVIVVVFFEARLRAVGRTVLAQIAGAKIRGDHFKRSPTSSRATGEDRKRVGRLDAARRTFPIRGGVALPTRRLAVGTLGIEVKLASLIALVGFELERVFVGPGNA